MEFQELVTAVETMQKAAELATGFHKDHPQAKAAMEFRVLSAMLGLQLSELARGLNEGMEPLDAFIAMLKGDRPLSAEAIKTLEDGRKANLQ